jgi:murein DD-endopeptidase MepM/ murein hydrolase activator NlpD
MRKKPSKNIYQLPFDEKLNLQPEPAPFHYELDGGWGRNAVDFKMPEGTPIVAALDGLVLEVIDNYNQGGPDESFLCESNLITIQHANNEYSVYVHLKKGSLVKECEEVKAGQIIAYAGNSGFTTYPHLHFHVIEDNEQQMIPIKFRIGDKVVVLSSQKK